MIRRAVARCDRVAAIATAGYNRANPKDRATTTQESVMKAAKVIAWGGFLALVLLGCNAPEAADEPQAQPAAAKVYECRYCLGTIEIDGVINEAAWKKPKASQEIDFLVHWQNRKPK